MAPRPRARSAAHQESGVLVTVARGHTQEAFRMFRLGEEEPVLTVGAQGDWQVAGPGVVATHLRLSFNGRELFAAAANGTTLLHGRPLGNNWIALNEGDELRFGFALLRVGGGSQPGRRERHVPPANRALLIWSIGGALLLLLSLATLAALLRGSATVGASAVASASVAEAAPSASSLTPPAPLAEPAPPNAATVAPVVPLPPVGDQDVSALNQGAGAAPAKPPAAFPQNIADRPIPRVGDEPWLISEEWREHHERLLNAAGRASAKVVFLGDSITEGWWSAPAYKQYFGKYAPLNLGLASDTTQNVLWRLEHGALDGTHPQLVVTLVGINNLAGGFSPEDTAAGLRAIVASVQRHVPGVRVLLLAVLPARQDPGNPLRQKIADCNKLLQGIAQPGRVDLLDVGSVLLEPDGSIVKTTLRDYLHPTPEGYEKLSRAILPKLEALLGG